MIPPRRLRPPRLRRIAHRMHWPCARQRIAPWQPSGMPIENLRFNVAGRQRRGSLRTRQMQFSATGRGQAGRNGPRHGLRPARKLLQVLVQLIAPMMPHLAEEMLDGPGMRGPRRRTELAGCRSPRFWWKIQSPLPVQVNGKKRGTSPWRAMRMQTSIEEAGAGP